MSGSLDQALDALEKTYEFLRKRMSFQRRGRYLAGVQAQYEIDAIGLRPPVGVRPVL
jgi:hypothetical protein